MEAKITIVVPIYNVEKYLGRCIESLLKQTYTNLDIVLVDDGSPDNCGQICDAYAKTDDRIRVIHKPNGGLSDARNAGIDIAKGDFIGFVDSDDFIHPDMFRSLYDLIDSNQADIAQCSFQRVYDDEQKDPGSDSAVRVLSREQTLDFMYTPFRVDYIVAWNKLYRMDLFKEQRYPKSKIHEDEFTTYKLVYQSKKIVVSHKKYYYYFQSPNSIIRSTFNEKKLHFAEAMEERIRFFEEKNMGKYYTKTMISYAQWLLLFMYRNRKELKTLPQVKSNLNERYVRLEALIKTNQAIGQRTKYSFGMAAACPLVAGFFIFQHQYKNNALGKFARLAGLIVE